MSKKQNENTRIEILSQLNTIAESIQVLTSRIENLEMNADKNSERILDVLSMIAKELQVSNQINSEIKDSIQKQESSNYSLNRELIETMDNSADQIKTAIEVTKEQFVSSLESVNNSVCDVKYSIRENIENLNCSLERINDSIQK